MGVKCGTIHATTISQCKCKRDVFHLAIEITSLHMENSRKMLMSPSQKDLFKLEWNRQYVNCLKLFMSTSSSSRLVLKYWLIIIFSWKQSFDNTFRLGHLLCNKQWKLCNFLVLYRDNLVVTIDNKENKLWFKFQLNSFSKQQT